MSFLDKESGVQRLIDKIGKYKMINHLGHRINNLDHATSSLGSIEYLESPNKQHMISEDNAHHILMLENNELRRLMKKLSESLSYLISKKLSQSTPKKSNSIQTSSH